MRLPLLSFASAWPYLAMAFLLASCGPSDEETATGQDPNTSPQLTTEEVSGAPAGSAQTQEDGRYFLENVRMADVYHVGLPCEDSSDEGYSFIVDTTAPHLFDDGYVHATLRYSIAEMQKWQLPNSCRHTETVGVAVFRSDGQDFARAEFVYDTMFLNDLRVTHFADPPPKKLAARIVDIVKQGGDKWYRHRSWDDGYDAFRAISELEALLPEAGPEDVAQIHYLMGRILQRRDLMDRRQAASGTNADEFWAQRSNPDGERRYVSLLREAAELGHKGAAHDLFDASELKGHIFPYTSSASHYAPDDAEISKLLSKYGFIFDMAREHNIGSLLGAQYGLAQRGFALGEQGVFADATLPPSADMIEAELNRYLGRTLAMQDGLLSEIYGIPRGVVYDCDGTWCRMQGGLGGRVRMNIRGLPDCADVISGRTVCSFTLAINVDSSEVFGNMPYQREPVVDFMQGMINEATRLEDWPVVQATMVRGDQRWSIAELSEF